jgi:hypothetical protein
MTQGWHEKQKTKTKTKTKKHRNFQILHFLGCKTLTLSHHCMKGSENFRTWCTNAVNFSLYLLDKSMWMHSIRKGIFNIKLGYYTCKRKVVSITYIIWVYCCGFEGSHRGGQLYLMVEEPGCTLCKPPTCADVGSHNFRVVIRTDCTAIWIIVWFRYSTFVLYFHSAIRNEAVMQVHSTCESKMQILTYNWISNFVEQILKNHNTELYT